MEGLRLINTFLAGTITKVNNLTDEQIGEDLSQPLGEFFDEMEKFVQEAREAAGEEELKEMTFGDFLEQLMESGVPETEEES